MDGVHRACYGIAEIADSVGVGRQLVAAWRRRRSHGMPEPDAELASGPVWLASTIEPWIERLPARPAVPDPVRAEEARRVARRVLRLLALLLEDAPRTALVTRAIAEVRELAGLAVGADGDPVRAAMVAVLGPVSDEDPGRPAVGGDPSGANTYPDLRRRLLEVLPVLADLVLPFEGVEPARPRVGRSADARA